MSGWPQGLRLWRTVAMAMADDGVADGGGGRWCVGWRVLKRCGGLRWRQTVQQTAMAAIHQSCTPCFRNRLRYSVGGMPISWVKTLE